MTMITIIIESHKILIECVSLTPNNGIITGKPGSKTKNGGVTVPGAKDVKQLYEYLNNGKYH